MTEVDSIKDVPRPGIGIYNIPSIDSDGSAILILTSTEQVTVCINPNNPVCALTELKARRRRNANGHLPAMTTALLPILDGTRRVGEGDLISGTIEIIAGAIIEAVIFYRGMGIQQQIDLLRDALQIRMANAYREQLNMKQPIIEPNTNLS